MIYIDDREGSADMGKLIEGSITVRLDYGDAMVTGYGPEGPVEIGVERKKIGDLINSIATGRLSGHQLPGLLSHYFRVYLVVEGTWMGRRGDDSVEIHKYGNMWTEPRTGKRKWRAGDLWAYLTTLEAVAGVTVRTTPDIVETCKTIEYLDRWWGKQWDAHRGHDAAHKAGPPNGYAHLTKPSLVRRMAAELPHVGWKRSKAVEARFATIEDMVVATEEEWREVEGLGSISVRDIYKSIHKGE